VSRPRLVLVTPRFWPSLGGAEVMMGRLAAAFQAAGSSTTVLTPRAKPDWPPEIEQRGVHVVRLPLRGGGRLRYRWSLARWLVSHSDEFELVYVSSLRRDAYEVLKAARRAEFPVVLRAEGADSMGDCHWQEHAQFGRRIRRRSWTADAVVASSRVIERELLAAGYSRQRVHHIPNGVDQGATRTDAARAAAREALCSADPSLFVAAGAPVAVYAGRLEHHRGLDLLVLAWKQVCARWPNARLWLAGHGPWHSVLDKSISDMGLGGRVVLPGAFDGVEDLLMAADLFVAPSLEGDASLAVLEAMAAGLPVVATDIPAHRELIDDGREGRLVLAHHAESIAAGIEELFDQPATALQFAEAARIRVSRGFTLKGTVAEHLALFDRVLSSARGLRHGPVGDDRPGED